MRDKPINVDTYIASFPIETRVLLAELRTSIKEVAPNAVEVISYQMPAFKLKKILVHFAGYKNHIGFYPGVSGIEAFKNEISGYKWAKGSVQFPLNQPLPLDLITRMVDFRANEDLHHSKNKTKE